MQSLLDAIGLPPALPGARCRGRSATFDPSDRGEPPDVRSARHAQAVKLCGRCPAFARCESWLLGLPKNRWPRGVVAGRIVTGAAGVPTFAAHLPSETTTEAAL